MPELDKEDQARVDWVLSRPQYQRERKPFRPWLMMGIWVMVLAVISAISWAIAAFHGYV